MEETIKTSGKQFLKSPKMSCRGVSVHYNGVKALHDVTMDIGRNEIISLIGPSGCGKTTFLRCLNRMNDEIEKCEITGTVSLDGVNIYDKNVNPVLVRARIGMVFQKPNPFPKSVFDNVAYGPRLHKITKNKQDLVDIVEDSLTRAGLWDEVKDRLQEKGTSLSGGQQQRLCIARAIAVKPEIILMDEPCSALDPIATTKIEELMVDLKEQYTIAIVTHSMAQANRVSNRTAYFHLGKLIEIGQTEKIFNKPKHELTENYISGKIG